MARSRIFTAGYGQVTTYLVGVTMGTIALLVFLNASISFVITDLIGQKINVGDATGTLGLADELVIIFFSPIWGSISDHIGVQIVSAVGFALMALSFLVITQVRAVYPDLLLARLLFSLGAAASSCMITAILPAVCSELPKAKDSASREDYTNSCQQATRETRDDCSSTSESRSTLEPSGGSTSRAGGMVGFASGIGALFGFLGLRRIPAMFEKNGTSPAHALKVSYGITALVSLLIAIGCFFGLRGLSGRGNTGTRQRPSDSAPGQGGSPLGYSGLLKAARLTVLRRDFGLAYLGGFVARASSVGVSLFVPLYVNTCFISSGLCDLDPHRQHDVKSNCRSAFVVSSQMTGVSQAAGLIFALVLGAFAGIKNAVYPLALSSALGLVGFLLLARSSCPSAESNAVDPGLLVIMAVVGISQIGAVVCSLGLLGKCVLSVATSEPSSGSGSPSATGESTPLIENIKNQDYSDIKGSIAGIYNLTGGLGILLLTKVGGLLFDKLSDSAPFIMLATFNVILLSACLLYIVSSKGILANLRTKSKQ